MSPPSSGSADRRQPKRPPPRGCAPHAWVISTPVSPNPWHRPSDWARPGRVVCQCRHCGELSRFLADPAHETWSLKAPQADRSHVEDTIRKSSCDLDFTTLRRSSPHSLVCTKNQASYERRALQRKKDLEDLSKIEDRLE